MAKADAARVQKVLDGPVNRLLVLIAMIASLVSGQVAMAEIKKRVDRFDDFSFTTIYKSNFGECSRINNKELQGRHQLECWIGATTFKHSHDRTVGIAFSDTFTDPNDFSDVGGDRKHIYLLFTLKDASQKRLTLSIISNKIFTWKEGALKGKKSLTIIGL